MPYLIYARYCAVAACALLLSIPLEAQQCPPIAPRIESLLPNPSLEQFDATQFGCASRQPGGRPDATNQANCLVGWQRVSRGTTDAWNAFTLSGDGPTFPAALPQPLPSGTGVAGFWVGIRQSPWQIFLNGDLSITERYREYLAACLPDGPLETDTDYRLTFHLGFIPPQEFDHHGQSVDVSSPAPIELAVYGVRECAQLNFGEFFGCPEESGAEGYELITTITVDGEAGRWTPATVDFQADYPYAGFAIGGSCGPDNDRPDGGYYRNYYFIDDLILNRREAFDRPTVGPVSVTGRSICDDSIRLSVAPVVDAGYQWYQDGKPIGGATSSTLHLRPRPDMDGDYTVKMTTPNGCGTSDAVRIQRPVIYDQFADSVALCSEGNEIEVSATPILGATYTWQDGSEGASYLITGPGTYTVTISTSCEQRVETFAAVVTDTFPYEFAVSRERACAGDTLTVALETDWHVPLLYYLFDDGRDTVVDSRQPIEIVAGTTTGIDAYLVTDCGYEFQRIDLPSLPPLEVTADVTDLNCHGPTGKVTVRTDADNPNLQWFGPSGDTLNSVGHELTAYTPGTYRLTVSDADHCTSAHDFEVGNNGGFRLDLEVTDVSCGKDGIAVALPRGGTPPYRIDWTDYADTTTLKRGRVRNGLGRGTYLARLTDSLGCATEAVARIGGPGPLSTDVVADYQDCAADSTGTLTVSAWGGTPPYEYSVEDVATQMDPTFTVGAGDYRVTVVDDLGCRSVPRMARLTLPEPVRLGVLGPDRVVFGESIELEADITGDTPMPGSIVWTAPGDLSYPRGQGGPRTRVQSFPQTDGWYTATFTSANRCTYVDSLFVEVDKVVRYYVPNAFSPNADRRNDHWRVYTTVGVTAVESLSVYDRWGGLVWRASGDGAATGWDGMRNGRPAAGGTYVYTGALRLIDGGVERIEGTVVVIR